MPLLETSEVLQKVAILKDEGVSSVTACVFVQAHGKLEDGEEQAITFPFDRTESTHGKGSLISQTHLCFVVRYRQYYKLLI